MPETLDTIELLILKYISQADLDVEETTRLQVWRSASPANEALLVKMQDDSFITAKLAALRKVDTDRMWNAFTELRAVEKARVRRLRFIRYSAAAVFLATIVITGLRIWSVNRSSAGRTASETAMLHVRTDTGNVLVKLPDGSQVWLNCGSMLSYPAIFSGGFRDVILDSGEALVRVADNAKIPFRVRIHDKLVEVLGTSFNLRYYPNEERIRATLVQGSIRIYHGPHSVILHPGEQACMTQGAGTPVVRKTDTLAVLAWRHGEFNFDGLDIPEALGDISRRYAMKLTLTSGIAGGRLGSGDIIPRTMKLEDLLEGLDRDRLHFRIDRQTNTIIVTPYKHKK